MARITLLRLRKPLIWFLLPVALLTGRPMVGCVCSDGSYKVSCEKLIGSLVWPQGKPQLSCCPGAQTGSCPACHKAGGQDCDGVSSNRQCVCRGIENNLKLTSSVDVDQDDHSTFVEFTNPEIAFPQSSLSSVLENLHRTDLPPLDRVVLFSHLTI
jgi:hypothetical protein